MPSFDDLAQKKEELVRKPLDGSLFRARMTAEHISAATLFGKTGDLAVLPTGYSDLGLLNTDGMGFSRDITSADISAFGRNTPVRSDVTADTAQLTATAIETKLETIELGTGAIILPGSRSTLNGSLEIKQPPRPTPRKYHFLAVAVDLTDDGEIYVCQYLPQGKISGYGDQAFGGGDDPIGWNVTVQGQFDSTFGASRSWIFGGPGWNALLVKMGFTAYTPAP